MQDKTIHALCTLFNSVYLDKGIVLYQSLEKVAKDFTLYILAMDDKCYDVLVELNYPHVIPIRLSSFENEELLVAKSNRSFGQYCWTCASSLILYILNTYTPDYCSYIDADMKFYSDPVVLINEMKDKSASVSIVGHRFSWYAEKNANILGKYCVECNTFKNDEKARSLLGIWIGQCLEECSQKEDGIHWGDQKYMDNWVDDYDYVIETSNLGAGIAPWNISQYKLVNNSDDGYIVKCKGESMPILFYHFEGITYKSLISADIHIYCCWGIDDKLVNLLYKSYLHEILKAKEMLRDLFSVDSLITHHPTSKKLSKYQSLIKKLKVLYSEGLVGLFFHTIPRILYFRKDQFSIL